MQVILQKDVANVGKKFSVVDVPNGFALNKLIPTGMAVAATEQNLQQLASRRAKQAAETADEAAAFAAAVAAIGDQPVTVAMEANENGQLFQAVHAEQIAAAAGPAVTADMVDVSEVIKSVGTHTVQLRMGDESHDVTIAVIAA